MPTEINNGGDCTGDVVCVDQNAECDPSSNQCVCVEGFTEVNGTCVPRK